MVREEGCAGRTLREKRETDEGDERAGWREYTKLHPPPATHRSTPLKNATPAQSPHDKIGGRVLVVVSGEGPLVGERNLQPVWDIIIV
ncbi:hypothetical protein Pmani_032721 [Petrolisthes manimaculis]|uniref:Uncharacterized protein n=1 Tax=Petrolisthes manimaculis TaxID=1843537 RepID=A0AAE1NS34_9EUCA|nr:hypothetical protein Pmani_032721 [Petrolisthes manimaculis]